MEKEKLLNILNRCAEGGDTEVMHLKADDALVEYINDQDITNAYEKINKWYA